MSDHHPSPTAPSSPLPKPSSEPPPDDVVLRALTDEGSLRVVVVGLDAAATTPIQLHARTRREAAAFGELLAAAALVRETVAPGLRVQMVLRGERGGHMVADSFPDGLVRGFIARPAEEGGGPVERAGEDEGGRSAGEVVLGAGSVLQVSRQMPNGRLHQSVVPVERPAAHGSVVAAAVEAYLQSSEQITASSDVGAFQVGPLEGGPEAGLAPGGGAWRARAWLVQVMPGAERELVSAVTERLAQWVTGPGAAARRARLDGPPSALVGALLEGVPHTLVAQAPLHAGCRCSEDRVFQALATLGSGDVRALVEQGEDVELTCDYCRTAYRFPAARVAGLLAEPASS